MAPYRIRLVHWNAVEAQGKATRLIAAGYDVNYDPFTPATMRDLKQATTDAVVIDLARLPSQGRDIALLLRQSRKSRHIPLIMVAGDPLKTARVRDLLPDAVFTTWEQIENDLPLAIQSPPIHVIVPASSFAAYADAPLVQKLGIKANFRVGLINPPPFFEQSLGDLPEGVLFVSQPGQPCDLLIWFAQTRQELVDGLALIQTLIGRSGLWIAWPKKTSSSGLSSLPGQADLTQPFVRRSGLDAGLVDFKICAIDATWTGLRFTRRKPVER
jgi:hypothetical protein